MNLMLEAGINIKTETRKYKWSMTNKICGTWGSSENYSSITHIDATVRHPGRRIGQIYLGM